MLDWPTLIAAGVGGLFGIGASLGSVELQRRRQAVQAHRELLTSAVVDTLRSMQRYMREILSLAYAEGAPYTREVIEGVEHVFPGAEQRLTHQETFDQVISEWNSALHRLLIVAPPAIISLSRQLDSELDRLLDQAIDYRWSREAFRAERVHAGEVAAALVHETRRSIGAGAIPITNAWTWVENVA